MRNLVDKITQRIRAVYQKAEGIIEEEKELALSQHLVNTILKRYVTDKVDQLDELRADLYEDWMRLYATLEVKGIKASLAANFTLVQFKLDKDIQRLVFEQQSKTDMLELQFDQSWKKIAVMAVLGVFRVLGKDPLGPLLKYLGIITIQHGLFYVDLAEYLSDQPKVMSALRRIQVNYAVLRPETLALKTNVNLRAVLKIGPSRERYLADHVSYDEPSALV